MINTMLIGIGPHAKRIYLPFLKKYKSKFKINLCVGVECKEKEHIEKLSKLGYEMEALEIQKHNNLEQPRFFNPDYLILASQNEKKHEMVAKAAREQKQPK